MSIQDYNDDSLIENCQRNGCYYNLNATIYLGLTNSLDIDVTYKGGANLNQLISIKNFVIYYGEDRIFH